MPLFQARSADRDARADKARLDALIRHIGEVREGVLRERRGLERRHADAVGLAADLVDNDHQVAREAEDEAALTRAEADLLHARRRLAELDRQLGVLDGLIERVRVLFDAPDAIERLRRR